MTTDAGSAAEQWTAAFYMAKDVIAEIRPIPFREVLIGMAKSVSR